LKLKKGEKMDKESKSYLLKIPKEIHRKLLHVKADTGIDIQDLILGSIETSLKFLPHLSQEHAVNLSYEEQRKEKK
jgi:hypothetical protein